MTAPDQFTPLTKLNIIDNATLAELRNAGMDPHSILAYRDSHTGKIDLLRNDGSYGELSRAFLDALGGEQRTGGGWGEGVAYRYSRASAQDVYRALFSVIDGQEEKPILPPPVRKISTKLKALNELLRSARRFLSDQDYSIYAEKENDPADGLLNILNVVEPGDISTVIKVEMDDVAIKLIAGTAEALRFETEAQLDRRIRATISYLEERMDEKQRTGRRSSAEPPRPQNWAEQAAVLGYTVGNAAGQKR